MGQTSKIRLAALALSMVLIPRLAEAQAKTPEEMERAVLEWATECAQKSAKTLERWVDSRELTLEKLTSFLYYPIPNTVPQKFSTDYDKLSDRDISAIQESYLTKSSEILFVVMVDRNGYLPTHNRRYSQPLTGNRETDLTNNRTKRIFNDRVGLTAARNTQPFLIQRYQRDTGELLVDLSVPILVKGKHWGAIRFGYRGAAK